MTHVTRRRPIFSWIALAAGVGLVYFELSRRGGASAVEFNFWLIVGALLIFFALLDLLSRKPPGPA